MDTKIKAIIVDDEEGARESLANLIKNYFSEEVEVVYKASRAREGYDQIKALKPELVFLDIEMPLENGFQMLSRFHHIFFDVIFVTAYDHYAIKAIKFSALDYLLKPVDIDELGVAINKVKRKHQAAPQREEQHQVLQENIKAEDPKKRIAIPDNSGMIFVELNEIVRCESDANYTKIFLTNGKRVIASKTLGDYEEMLGGDGFFRVHRSHLINLYHLSRFDKSDGGMVHLSDGSSVEVSRRKKKAFLELLGS